VFSCGQATNLKENKVSVKQTYEIEIDSLFSAMVSEHNAVTNIHEFEYQYMYELQDFFTDSAVIGIKYFNQFQLVRGQDGIFCTYTIDDFNNYVYLDLSLPKEMVEQFKYVCSSDTTNYFSVVIQIDAVEVLPFELNSELTDYHSRILVGRSASLIGKGKILTCSQVVEVNSKARLD